MKSTKRVSVLYAEYNEDAGFMLSTLLGFSDIDVLLARSIKDAFEAAQDRHFDLYLLDSRFVDGTGFDLCQQLHRFNPQTPIVFYSGDAHETDRQKGLSAGANVYLVKPDVETVAPTIHQLVAQISENVNDEELSPQGISIKS
jgi:DNA-binding response OmpR family regulator